MIALRWYSLIQQNQNMLHSCRANRIQNQILISNRNIWSFEPEERDPVGAVDWAEIIV